MNVFLTELKVKSAVLDGEIVCLNNDGKPEFHGSLFQRGESRFVAFHLATARTCGTHL